MSVGCDITWRIKVQIYRRNEDDIWPWQGNLTFDTKNRIVHKRMRAIARQQRLVGFTSPCVIRWRCMNSEADTAESRIELHNLLATPPDSIAACHK